MYKSHRKDIYSYLIKGDGKSINEIAEALGLTPNAIYCSLTKLTKEGILEKRKTEKLGSNNIKLFCYFIGQNEYKDASHKFSKTRAMIESYFKERKGQFIYLKDLQDLLKKDYEPTRELVRRVMKNVNSAKIKENGEVVRINSSVGDYVFYEGNIKGIKQNKKTTQDDCDLVCDKSLNLIVNKALNSGMRASA